MLHILKLHTIFQPISQTMRGLSTPMGRGVEMYSENTRSKLPRMILMELNLLSMNHPSRITPHLGIRFLCDLDRMKMLLH